MRILLPPSEGKSVPDQGAPLDLATLSHRPLNPVRRELVRAAARTAGASDALTRFGVGPGLRDQVLANRSLATAPTAPAIAIYSGVLFDALDYAGASPEARAWLDRTVLIFSALWGVVTPTDAIPAYRVSAGSRLLSSGRRVADRVDLPSVATMWKQALRAELSAITDEIVLDARSSGYAAMWTPGLGGAANVAALHVLRESNGRRSVVSHHAKHTRGLVTRFLADAIVAGAPEPRSVSELAALIGTRWDVEVTTRAGKPARLDVVEAG